MSDIKFNLNQNVRVQLTEEGREIHRKGYEDLVKQFPNISYEYEVPKEDKDGWSKWQMWNLIQIFGSHIAMGIASPFNTTIILETEAE